MIRWLIPVLALGATAAPAQQAAPDYREPASWLCRAGDSGACTSGLDAMAITAAGGRAARPHVPAAAAAIDCFYVYPTVSADAGRFSDLIPGPEEQLTARLQAGRFSSVCRLFAPIYRQVTSAGLRALAGAPFPDGAAPTDVNYADIKAAWQGYLTRDNKGRGVVLIGHSQGAFLLKRLIAEEIDGKPAQKLLVSALLAGNVDLTVARGSDRGGSFRTVPLCRAADQTGCVVAWSTYAENDVAPRRVFGGNGRAGQVAACVNPAALGGGRAPLRSILPNPLIAPPFVEATGLVSGECVTDDQGAVLRVRAEEGPFAAMVRPVMERKGWPGFGLHIADISLVEGDLVALVARQGDAWARQTRP